MVVFIPHPAEALLLSRIQKKILFSLNEKNCCWTPCFPLWMIPDENGANLKAASFRGKTRTLTIYAPAVNGARLYFPAELIMNDGEKITGKIRAGKKQNATAPQEDEPAGEHILEGEFPLVCGIYRAADAQITQFLKNGFKWQVEQSFWIKNK